jgi:hypothetical protein
MINTVTVDKDILLVSIVDSLGGGLINWKEKEVTLVHNFLGKKIWNTQELVVATISNGRNILYRGN